MEQDDHASTLTPSNDQCSIYTLPYEQLPLRSPLARTNDHEASSLSSHLTSRQGVIQSPTQDSTISSQHCSSFCVPGAYNYGTAASQHGQAADRLRRDSRIGSHDDYPSPMAEENERQRHKGGLSWAIGHENEEPIRCFEHGCNGRTFSNKDNYKRHIREQQNLTKVQCPFCNRDFSRKNNLDSHLKKGRCKIMIASMEWDRGLI